MCSTEGEKEKSLNYVSEEILQPHVRFALDILIQGRYNDKVAKISDVGSYIGAILSQYNGPWRKLWYHLKCFCECLNWDDAITFQFMI
jgi:hypothetical protein